MQTTSNATLFQTSYSEALGAYRARKAIQTSGFVSSVPSAGSLTGSEDSKARYGYPIHLHPQFEEAVIKNAADLAVEGSGADGGRYRILSLRVIGNRIWTSEAGGIVRETDAESGKTVAVYKGAKAPVPSFDFMDQGRLLVTGSWDKSIRVYRIPCASSSVEGVPVKSVLPVLEVENAMSDFIKAIHVFQQRYIATAGSDKSVMVWDATHLLSADSNSTFKGTLKCIHQSKAHTRPINALSSLEGLDGITRLYSADSMGRILESTLNPSTLRLEVEREIQGFTTSVYDLQVGWSRQEVEGETSSLAGKQDAFLSEVKEDSDGSRYRLIADLWGASGDKSAAGYRLSPLLQPSSPTSKSGGARSASAPVLGTQEPLTTPYIKIPHTDFVKTVLPLSLYLLPSMACFERFAGAVVTGGSDEHLRLFSDPPDSSFSAQTVEEGQVYEIEAHWHEITSLALWNRTPSPLLDSNSTTSALPPVQGDHEAWLVSTSLDGSIRRFRLESIAHLPKPELIRPQVDAPQHGAKVHQWDQNSLPPVSARKHQESVVGMTQEEEAELAELMASDDE